MDEFAVCETTYIGLMHGNEIGIRLDRVQRFHNHLRENVYSSFCTLTGQRSDGDLFN